MLQKSITPKLTRTKDFAARVARITGLSVPYCGVCMDSPTLRNLKDDLLLDGAVEAYRGQLTYPSL